MLKTSKFIFWVALSHCWFILLLCLLLLLWVMIRFSFPIDAGEGVRTLNDVSMWEQLSLAAFLQKHWADNQVSCTVTFDPETEGPQLQHALDVYQYQLKVRV